METLEVEVAMEDLPIYDSCCIVGIGPTLVCPNPPDPTEIHHRIISRFENVENIPYNVMGDDNFENTSAETNEVGTKLRRANFIEIEVKHYSFEDGILVEKVVDIATDELSYWKDCRFNRRRSEELEALKDMKLQLSSLFVNNLDEMRFSKDQSLASPSEFQINVEDKLHLESKSNSMSNDILSANVDSLSDEVFESESQTEARKEMLMFALHRTKAKSNICFEEAEECGDSSFNVDQDSPIDKAINDDNVIHVGDSNKRSDVATTLTGAVEGKESVLDFGLCASDNLSGHSNIDSDARPLDNNVNFLLSLDSPCTNNTSSTESGSYSLYSLFDSETEVDRKEEIITVTRRDSFNYSSVKTYEQNSSVEELNPHLEAISFHYDKPPIITENENGYHDTELINAEEEVNEVCPNPDTLHDDTASDNSSVSIYQPDIGVDSVKTGIISRNENDFDKNFELDSCHLSESMSVEVDLEISVKVDIGSTSVENGSVSSISSSQNENGLIDFPTSKEYNFSAYAQMLKERGLQNCPNVENIKKGTAEQIAKQIVQSVIIASQKMVEASTDKAINERIDNVPGDVHIKDEYNSYIENKSSVDQINESLQDKDETKEIDEASIVNSVNSVLADDISDNQVKEFHEIDFDTTMYGQMTNLNEKECVEFESQAFTTCNEIVHIGNFIQQNSSGEGIVQTQSDDNDRIHFDSKVENLLNDIDRINEEESNDKADENCVMNDIYDNFENNGLNITDSSSVDFNINQADEYDISTEDLIQNGTENIQEQESDEDIENVYKNGISKNMNVSVDLEMSVKVELGSSLMASDSDLSSSPVNNMNCVNEIAEQSQSKEGEKSEYILISERKETEMNRETENGQDCSAEKIARQIVNGVLFASMSLVDDSACFEFHSEDSDYTESNLNGEQIQDEIEESRDIFDYAKNSANFKQTINKGLSLASGPNFKITENFNDNDVIKKSPSDGIVLYPGGKSSIETEGTKNNSYTENSFSDDVIQCESAIKMVNNTGDNAKNQPEETSGDIQDDHTDENVNMNVTLLDIEDHINCDDNVENNILNNDNISETESNSIRNVKENEKDGCMVKCDSFNRGNERNMVGDDDKARLLEQEHYGVKNYDEQNSNILDDTDNIDISESGHDVLENDEEKGGNIKDNNSNICTLQIEKDGNIVDIIENVYTTEKEHKYIEVELIRESIIQENINKIYTLHIEHNEKKDENGNESKITADTDNFGIFMPEHDDFQNADKKESSLQGYKDDGEKYEPKNNSINVNDNMKNNSQENIGNNDVFELEHHQTTIADEKDMKLQGITDIFNILESEHDQTMFCHDQDNNLQDNTYEHNDINVDVERNSIEENSDMIDTQESHPDGIYVEADMFRKIQENSYNLGKPEPECEDIKVDHEYVNHINETSVQENSYNDDRLQKEIENVKFDDGNGTNIQDYNENIEQKQDDIDVDDNNGSNIQRNTDKNCKHSQEHDQTTMIDEKENISQEHTDVIVIPNQEQGGIEDNDKDESKVQESLGEIDIPEQEPDDIKEYYEKGNDNQQNIESMTMLVTENDDRKYDDGKESNNKESSGGICTPEPERSATEEDDDQEIIFQENAVKNDIPEQEKSVIKYGDEQERNTQENTDKIVTSVLKQSDVKLVGDKESKVQENTDKIDVTQQKVIKDDNEQGGITQEQENNILDNTRKIDISELEQDDIKYVHESKIKIQGNTAEIDIFVSNQNVVKGDDEQESSVQEHAEDIGIIEPTQNYTKDVDAGKNKGHENTVRIEVTEQEQNVIKGDEKEEGNIKENTDNIYIPKQEHIVIKDVDAQGSKVKISTLEIDILKLTQNATKDNVEQEGGNIQDNTVNVDLPQQEHIVIKDDNGQESNNLENTKQNDILKLEQNLINDDVEIVSSLVENTEKIDIPQSGLDVIQDNDDDQESKLHEITDKFDRNRSSIREYTDDIGKSEVKYDSIKDDDVQEIRNQNDYNIEILELETDSMKLNDEEESSFVKGKDNIDIIAEEHELVRVNAKTDRFDQESADNESVLELDGEKTIRYLGKPSNICTLDLNQNDSLTINDDKENGMKEYDESKIILDQYDDITVCGVEEMNGLESNDKGYQIEQALSEDILVNDEKGGNMSKTAGDNCTVLPTRIKSLTSDVEEGNNMQENYGNLEPNDDITSEKENNKLENDNNNGIPEFEQIESKPVDHGNESFKLYYHEIKDDNVKENSTLETVDSNVILETEQNNCMTDPAEERSDMSDNAVGIGMLESLQSNGSMILDNNQEINLQVNVENTCDGMTVDDENERNILGTVDNRGIPKTERYESPTIGPDNEDNMPKNTVSDDIHKTKTVSCSNVDNENERAPLANKGNKGIIESVTNDVQGNFKGHGRNVIENTVDNCAIDVEQVTCINVDYEYESNMTVNKNENSVIPDQESSDGIMVAEDVYSMATSETMNKFVEHPINMDNVSQQSPSSEVTNNSDRRVSRSSNTNNDHQMEERTINLKHTAKGKKSNLSDESDDDIDDSGQYHPELYTKWIEFSADINQPGDKEDFCLKEIEKIVDKIETETEREENRNKSADGGVSGYNANVPAIEPDLKSKRSSKNTLRKDDDDIEDTEIPESIDDEGQYHPELYEKEWVINAIEDSASRHKRRKSVDLSHYTEMSGLSAVDIDLKDDEGDEPVDPNIVKEKLENWIRTERDSTIRKETERFIKEGMPEDQYKIKQRVQAKCNEQRRQQDRNMDEIEKRNSQHWAYSRSMHSSPDGSYQISRRNSEEGGHRSRHSSQRGSHQVSRHNSQDGGYRSRQLSQEEIYVRSRQNSIDGQYDRTREFGDYSRHGGNYHTRRQTSQDSINVGRRDSFKCRESDLSRSVSRQSTQSNQEGVYDERKYGSPDESYARSRHSSGDERGDRISRHGNKFQINKRRDNFERNESSSSDQIYKGFTDETKSHRKDVIEKGTLSRHDDLYERRELSRKESLELMHERNERNQSYSKYEEGFMEGRLGRKSDFIEVKKFRKDTKHGLGSDKKKADFLTSAQLKIFCQPPKSPKPSSGHVDMLSVSIERPKIKENERKILVSNSSIEKLKDLPEYNSGLLESAAKKFDVYRYEKHEKKGRKSNLKSDRDHSRGGDQYSGQFNESGFSHKDNQHRQIYNRNVDIAVSASLDPNNVIDLYGKNRCAQKHEACLRTKSLVANTNHVNGETFYSSDPDYIHSRSKYQQNLGGRKCPKSIDGVKEKGRMKIPTNSGETSKDGPLSLTDTFAPMDRGQNDHANLSQSHGKLSDSTTSLNNRQAPAKSPSRQNTLMKQTSVQSNQSEINGERKDDPHGIKFERLKNLEEDDLMAKIKEIIGHLEKLEDYHRGDGMRIQKMLGDMYWDYTHLREMIADCMADNGYAVVSMKMLKTLNGIGIFKNDDVWFPTYYTYNTMWNFSDASSKLAKALSENDAVRLLTLNCGHKPYINALHSKNVFYVIKASLSILHNMARNSGMKHLFDENKTSETIMPFMDSEDEMLKILATLTIANIVDEEENKTVIAETGTIHCMVSWIEKAISLPRRRFKGFTPQELTEGLNKLAVNDSNKMRIVEESSLPMFLLMLQHEDVREQSSAARIIWTLSFDKDVRQKLIENTDLIATLEKLTESTNKSVQQNANGALWIIKGENDISRESKPKGTPTKSHVFLSYSWADKDTVLQIRDKLRAEGYAIWIDIEKGSAASLEGMANAIENSAVVLICMSEKYKQNPNCRTEAEYTFQLKKDYIPLMLQKKYRPDGWLGFILGAKLYFDFSGKYPFEKSLTGLLKELRGRGQVTPNTTPVGSNDTSDGNMVTSQSLTSYASPGTPVPSNSVLMSMGQEELVKWLRVVKLTECIPAFLEFDGRLLLQLKQMRTEAPEFFYQCLEKRLNMSLIEILKFTRALEELH